MVRLAEVTEVTMVERVTVARRHLCRVDSSSPPARGDVAGVVAASGVVAPTVGASTFELAGRQIRAGVTIEIRAPLGRGQEAADLSAPASDQRRMNMVRMNRPRSFHLQGALASCNRMRPSRRASGVSSVAMLMALRWVSDSAPSAVQSSAVALRLRPVAPTACARVGRRDSSSMHCESCSNGSGEQVGTAEGSSQQTVNSLRARMRVSAR